MTFNELCTQMINDSSFSLKDRLKAILSQFSYDEIIPVYNTITANMNVEDRDYDFTLTYEQLELVGQVFLTTSLARYENAFGAEWVKSHLRHHRKADLCITLRPDGFIETQKTYTSIDFITPVITYLTRRTDINISDWVVMAHLPIHDEIQHLIEEYAHLHGIDMKHLDQYTEKEKKLHTEMNNAFSAHSELEGY